MCSRLTTARTKGLSGKTSEGSAPCADPSTVFRVALAIGSRRWPVGRRTTTLEVDHTEWLTPHMIRVVAGGPDLAAFPDTPYTDRYVKLLFPRDGVSYPEPFDADTIRAEMPREHWPITRTYTLRAFDVARQLITIDFVYHGDEGFAGPWAASARPGDVLRLLGPGGAYAPDPDAD